MYLVHVPVAALILPALAVSPAATALERPGAPAPAAVALAPGRGEASVSLQGSLTATGAPTFGRDAGPGGGGGPSLGLALLERLRRHGGGGARGRHGTRVLILVVLVCLVVVPILAVFVTPAYAQKFLDENCCWFVPRSQRPEALASTGKGPAPTSPALKKAGRPAIKKRVSFSADILPPQGPPSVSSIASTPRASEHMTSQGVQFRAAPQGISAASRAAAPSAFTSPLPAEADLEKNAHWMLRPEVLNNAGYDNQERTSLTGLSRNDASIVVH